MSVSDTSYGKSLRPGNHTIALTVLGVERTYVVHVSSLYDRQTPSPVVVMLHGGGGTANASIWETGWTDKADKAGFLAVFPNALARDPTQRSHFSRNPQLWNDGSDRFYSDQKASNDIDFITAMLDDLALRFNLDKRRIFVTGFSNGASMSFLIGAALPHRIAAIAPVAGACWISPGTLHPPVPLIYITGTADPLNLIGGGTPKLANGTYDSVRAKPKPSVSDSILKWVKAINVPTTPSRVSDMNGVHTEIYGLSHSEAEVVYIAVDELGHTWAGGRSILPERMVGKTSNKISATDVIWDFFQKHPLSAENQ